MAFAKLTVAPSEVAVDPMLRLVLGLGGVMQTAITRPLVLTDLFLVPRDRGLVSGDDLFMLQEVRFVFMKFGFDAT